jgi:hypothetical protein
MELKIAKPVINRYPSVVHGLQYHPERDPVFVTTLWVKRKFFAKEMKTYALCLSLGLVLKQVRNFASILKTEFSAHNRPFP